jgi:uncharacterized protein DUF222
MFDQLRDAVGVVEGFVSALEPKQIPGRDAVALVCLFAKLERVAAAGRTLAGRRVEQTREWFGKGYPNAAKWMAEQAQTTLASAITTMETGRRLDELPATREAFATGALSAQQASQIAAAAATAPEYESSLIAMAKTESVNGLRNRCLQIQATAASRDLDADERIARSRYLRSWNDADGAVRLDARLTQDSGAKVLAVIATRGEELFERARAAGSRERRECYAADALVSLVDTSSPPGPKAVVNVLVSYEALKRGYLLKGERCVVPDMGPISIPAARRLASDAIVKAVLTDEADVRAIANFGRTIPARLRAAVEARDTVCVVPGCDETKELEIHHIKPLGQGGMTTLENLARPCKFHHHLITHRGWRLEGGPGSWQFLPPTTRGRPPPDTS